MRGDGDCTELMIRLLTKHQEELFRYIFGLLPNEEDAKDALQETSVSLYRKSAEYEPDKPFLAWAYRFAYVEVMKQRERNQRGTRHLRPDLVERLARERERYDPVLQVRLHALDHCLEQLPAADRELIGLHYQAKTRIEEMVHQVGTSRRTLFRTPGAHPPLALRLHQPPRGHRVLSWRGHLSRSSDQSFPNSAWTKARDRRPIADIQRVMLEVLRLRAEPAEIPRRVAFGPEEVGPHIIVDPQDVIAHNLANRILRLLLNQSRGNTCQPSLKVENLPPEPKLRPRAFFTGDHLALDFVNSRSTPLGVWTEWLSNGIELVDWLEEAGAIDRVVASRFRADEGARVALDEAAERARGLREWLRGFIARHAGREVGAKAVAELGPLNDLLARSDCLLAGQGRWLPSGAVPDPDQPPSVVCKKCGDGQRPSSFCSRSRRPSPTWFATKTSVWSAPAKARAASWFSSTRPGPTPGDGAAWLSVVTCAKAARNRAPASRSAALQGEESFSLTESR